MSGLDWPGLLRVGIRSLGLKPDEFWRLTPAELFIMLGADQAPKRLSRMRLEELIRAFPDAREGRIYGGK
ncbi:MAG: phage tail assembly chaperone [Rhodobacteraceae bacterium]|nr:phage tail assembly chaperone [Paracoccaceae bacterium]